MELKIVWKQGGDEKASRTMPPLRSDAGPLSGLQRNALAFLVRFVTYTTKQTRDVSALHVGGQRGASIVS